MIVNIFSVQEIHYSYDITLKSLIARKHLSILLQVSHMAKLHQKDKKFSYLLCTLNNLTIEDPAKQIGINLKQRLELASLLFILAETANISALNSIIDVKNIFP